VATVEMLASVIDVEWLACPSQFSEDWRCAEQRRFEDWLQPAQGGAGPVPVPLWIQSMKWEISFRSHLDVELRCLRHVDPIHVSPRDEETRTWPHGLR
jgi:hypothetical protein